MRVTLPPERAFKSGCLMSRWTMVQASLCKHEMRYDHVRIDLGCMPSSDEIAASALHVDLAGTTRLGRRRGACNLSCRLSCQAETMYPPFYSTQPPSPLPSPTHSRRRWTWAASLSCLYSVPSVVTFVWPTSVVTVLCVLRIVTVQDLDASIQLAQLTPAPAGDIGPESHFR